ncbi:MAG TPA: c-type cytochrome [Arenimonas sp.]|uniref:c-type cytochrome n=1 Tax=Arenimonas sp. TaxID=1872635 RepID=UPI002D7FC9DB|nr:c-type cytochrome [Arenimonas sp.]HEU0154332.1 c-type cytochrome [Arenimonas sp.]
MKFTRILGVAALLAAGSTLAQEAATVTPAPEPDVAPVAVLEADNTPATWGDAQAGAGKAAACAACHGLDGNSADPQYPKLAGQHERYIARQLSLYKSGERNNAIMLGFASTLSAQDMRDIGAYFASQKTVPGVADDSAITSGPNQGLAFYEVGERIFRYGNPDQGVPACQACHGPTGRGNPGAAWPQLGGQHAGYTANALTAFRDGMVWGKGGNANALMAGVAGNLSDEEIQALATYIEGLHNADDTPPADAAAPQG